MNQTDTINILLVDDRPENLLALEAIIEQEDYNLVKAYSGEEALKYLLKFDFAVILLDVQMPGLDGFSTAKIIRAREKTKNIPILFVTANNLDSEQIFMGYSVGAIDYILKPVDPLILKSKVARFVEQYILRQKLIAQTKELEEKNNVIKYMAYHDGLTELPNRRMLNEQIIQNINKSKRLNEPLGVLFLDLDRFKYVNDSLGHLMGDKLLQLVAKRLQSNIREQDFVARIGGDEFVILLTNSDRDESLMVAQTILEAFKQPFYLDTYEFYITTCIGLAVFPYDGEDSISLLKNADAALYRAKEQGKNKYKVFHTGMNIESYRTFLLQSDLRKAIERDELSLVYQPKVNIHTGKISSVEALVRWHHPKWGMIPPNEFIPLAEEIGLIVEIDKWVLQNACNQIAQWRNNELGSIRIAVNFSAQHFLQKNLVNEIIEQLAISNIDPNLLEIEITETALLGNEEFIISTLLKLKELKIHVSLDDFGTGYSSLNYLRVFPFSTVKIDKAFIQELTNQGEKSLAIVESIIHLANRLSINVVAEGVETLEQLKILKELQCNEYQGYHFCRPLLPEELFEFLEKYETILTESPTESAPLLNNVIEIQKEPIRLNHDIVKLAIQQVKTSYLLSTREVDVFSLIVDGLTNKEISEKLYISEHTVKNHITNIFSKINVSDRVQAIALVYETCIQKEEAQ